MPINNRPLRVSLFTTDSLPYVGGIADYLDNLVRATSDMNEWSIYSIVPPDMADDTTTPYHINRLQVERHLGEMFGDGNGLLRRWNTFRWYCQRPDVAAEHIKNTVKTDQPDIVLIGRWCTDGHFWCKTLRRLQQKYAIFAYGLDLVEPVEPHPVTRYLTGPREADRCKDLTSAECVISISDATTTQLRSLGVAPDKIIKLTPGIDPGRLQPLPETLCRSTLEALGITGKYILAMGRLIPRKGFDLAVHAFADLSQEFPDIDLVIAGNGPAREDIATVISTRKLDDRVHMTGEVSHEQKCALYQGCEFYVMPNRPLAGDMEGFGIVFLEANLFGKAVIGGANGGVPDAVADGVSGLLVTTDRDHRPLADAMRRLLTEPDFRTRLGQDGRERALSQFDWKSLGRDFYHQLESALK